MRNLNTHKRTKKKIYKKETEKIEKIIERRCTI